ncbi:hypothetical protein D3C71_2051090 [compost metagenome]
MGSLTQRLGILRCVQLVQQFLRVIEKGIQQQRVLILHDVLQTIEHIVIEMLHLLTP